MLARDQIKIGIIFAAIGLFIMLIIGQLHSQSLLTINMPDNEFTLEWFKSLGIQDSIKIPASSYIVYIRHLQTETFTPIGKSIGYPFADTTFNINFKTIQREKGLKFPIGSILIFGISACLLDTLCSDLGTSLDVTARPHPWVMRITPNPPGKPILLMPRRIRF